ncbi:hypothetical protein DYI95_002020 [Thermaerobacter sp. PB12/4term]|uniref:hypothetical protein n=1 Tax=Thermaerobacter sp. PB12/4term TaxID=2293838 RepID=UPI000E325529|nr:hypothetical protein [Thermaerobacter sp. PB12/4term]QIA26474.1 hypothetical protein DYI95_002020 [Thermaerobacter sp. PB12/4term]
MKRTRRRTSAALAWGLFLAAIALAAAACGAPPLEPEPVTLYDVEGWPPFDRFLPAAELAGDVRVTARVTVRPVTRPGPDPRNPSHQVPWRDVHFEVRIEPAGGRALRGVVAGVRLNEALAPWIPSGLLVFGSDMHAPLDVGPGTESPGLLVSRVTGVPDPSVLSGEERRALRAALQTPMWLKLTWDGYPRYIRLEPGEDIQYQGLEVFGETGASGPGAGNR